MRCPRIGFHPELACRTWCIASLVDKGTDANKIEASFDPITG